MQIVRIPWAHIPVPAGLDLPEPDNIATILMSAPAVYTTVTVQLHVHCRILQLFMQPSLYRKWKNMQAGECQNYQSLTSAYRKVTYSYHSVQCDNGLGPGWFRFQGAAGTRMPTSCPPTHRCNTHATGWLNGGHPTVADGKVTRQVCFHWSSTCCDWSTNIQVRNCGSFYVYHFSGTPACSLRYCGTD